ncbi:MAG: acetate/propionate family kinase [Acidimicrobiales bacterium]
MRVLAVNAGSSSTKVSIVDGSITLDSLALPQAGDQSIEPAIMDLVSRYTPEVSGHRIVHGGAKYTSPLLVSRAAEDSLSELADLAPLHNPPALSLMDAVMALDPAMPAVACFDTTFFASLPGCAATYAIPASWRERWGIRRFGFHGLSHSWAVRRGAELVGQPAWSLRIVSAHLGSGASLAATAYENVMDTTMGFTPLEGLVMGTRSGSVDPGVITFIMRHEHLDPDDLENALEHRSGLLALAGTPDLQAVIERSLAGDESAELAWQVYLHRLRGAIGSMVAAMGGIDLLVFTGGAGENSPRLRYETCNGLGFLGLIVDPELNTATGSAHDTMIDPVRDRAGATLVEGGALCTDRIISPRDGIAIAIVHAREDLEIARQVETLLCSPE